MKSSNPEYIKNYTKQKAIEDLNRIKKRIDSLLVIYSNREKIDKETKHQVILMAEYFNTICNSEMDKELSKQKKEGKEFLSDEEIDKLIDKIIKR